VASKTFTVIANKNQVSVGIIVSTPASCQDGIINIKNIGHDEGHDVTVYYNSQSIGTFNPGKNFTYPGIGSGSYSFILKDKTNCSLTKTVNLNNNGYQPQFTSTVTEKVACSGKSNGRVLLGGGTKDNYSYKLYPTSNLTGSVVKSGAVSGANSFTIEGLSENAGYGIEIIDSKVFLNN
jgi:hypothetical protein